LKSRLHGTIQAVAQRSDQVGMTSAPGLVATGGEQGSEDECLATLVSLIGWLGGPRDGGLAHGLGRTRMLM
jgi:hypothetical protein